MNGATLVGIASTLLFASSMLPMVVRAGRTRDLTSYSRGHLVLTNVGNVVHSGYVATLPPGPVWALHGFYTAVSLQMLVWHVRWAPRQKRWSTGRSGSSSSSRTRAAR